MSLLIGMDEAGYGPNLGPLVITATAWEVPGDPHDCDVWNLLDEVVSQRPSTDGQRLHIADSKQVFSPSKGVKALETSVLCLLRLAGIEEDSFSSLWQQLAVQYPDDHEQEPWFSQDTSLPVVADTDDIDRLTERLTACAERAGIGRPRIRSDVVLTDRFNRLTNDHDSKGVTLSKLSLALLRTLWEPVASGRVFIVADKHGGRNRYDGLLADILDGQMIFRLEEGRERSSYRVGDTEIRFQTRAEAHFPVAVASLVSKYLRELAMLSFNRFWRVHLPHIRPTQGYPVDAKRFKAEIADLQSNLQIPDAVLWRER